MSGANDNIYDTLQGDWHETLCRALPNETLSQNFACYQGKGVQVSGYISHKHQAA